MCNLRRSNSGFRPVFKDILVRAGPSIDKRTTAKEALRAAIEGVDRGIFGLKKDQKLAIAELAEQLEAINPLPEPTNDLEKVSGNWKLVYTTVQILGSRRTKLGLRNFVQLGDFVQRIDVEHGLAVNEVAFFVPALKPINGLLTIEATYTVASPCRVNIKYEKSVLEPQQLQALFEKNFDILLSIFNPEGWLELTYVDEDMRIGRDDKGNLFVLEKM